ncbi:hypothetical protein RRG08_034388 [Elysia crispata]|uniref:Uncharacterized protein n=1 Tax=Elysia crispata TaxID=231223 RepID=A0AAE0YEK5_9GAST|nr:hypothetical protein RRG08_034388 [Elysia crispata]
MFPHPECEPGPLGFVIDLKESARVSRGRGMSLAHGASTKIHHRCLLTWTAPGRTNCSLSDQHPNCPVSGPERDKTVSKRLRCGGWLDRWIDHPHLDIWTCVLRVDFLSTLAIAASRPLSSLWSLKFYIRPGKDVYVKGMTV